VPPARRAPPACTQRPPDRSSRRPLCPRQLRWNTRRRAHASGSSAIPRPATGAAWNLLSPTEHPVPHWVRVVDYERHQPEKTLLCEVVRDTLESFLANARELGAPVARFVEREVRAYLDCGILSRGFLRLHCDACGRDRLLAFMRALFADQRRRARIHYGVQRAQCGSVTAIQRFAAELRSACASHALRARGSALNTNPHFHSIVLDGVYGGPPHAPGPFLPLPPPSTEDVARVMAGTARRVMRLLEKRGLESDEDTLAADEPLLATLMAASVRSRIATGPEAGLPWRRLGDRVDPVEAEASGEDAEGRAPGRCVREGGMSLHADVAVPARDRRRLERLSRYILRSPICLDRLEAQPDGRLSYKLKTQWRDGTTHILMERHELLERLAPLIPPPRAHQVRYFGILAPSASGRDHVVPGARRETSPASASHEGHREAPCKIARTRTCQPPGAETRPTPSTAVPEGAPSAGTEADPSASQAAQAARVPDLAQQAARRPVPATRPRRLPWADLLRRVFGIEALQCECGKSMRVIAAITEPTVAKRILECMGLPSRAPPLTPARVPSSAADAWLEEPADYDQSPPHDWAPGA
jgi:hypothetical protein